MTSISTKSAALTVMIALGSLMSSSAHAAILHTAGGTPVMTKEGAPVLSGNDGTNVDCPKGPILDYYAPQKADNERVVFFGFNKSELTKAAKHQLSHLAKNIHANKDQKISIVGYADRLGSAAYNEKLALKRAKIVHDFLIARGVKAKKMEVRSLGKSASKTSCGDNIAHAEMISCLSGDRRVEIEIK